ncbi:MAG: tRNA pseudouridine(55) synthase TruB [Candidatus Xenobiia bacterium LiM19]
MEEANNNRLPEGFLNILKPPGMTSHDVVGFLRRSLSQKKIGHCGTLDPGAAGVLPVALGRATKMIEYVPHDIKAYRAELHLGVATDTGDAFGRVLSLRPVRSYAEAELKKVLDTFLGLITQTPPAASAVKVRGKRLYQYHRQGEQVEIPSRSVRIDSLTVVDISADRLMLDIVCGGGTYIRSLAADIGEMLGCGASMSFLVRTVSGPFHLRNAIPLNEIESISRKGILSCALISPGEVLNHLPSLTVGCREEKMILNGVRLSGNFGVHPESEKTTVQVRSESGALIAIAELQRGDTEYLKPLKVLPGS